jgi:hypothetical protein
MQKDIGGVLFIKREGFVDIVGGEPAAAHLKDRVGMVGDGNCRCLVAHFQPLMFSSFTGCRVRHLNSSLLAACDKNLKSIFLTQGLPRRQKI